MEENQGINVFNVKVSGVVETRITPASTPMGLPKLTVIQQIKWLEGLFLLEIARFYINMWNELKVNMTELTRMWHITADNEHILKLINKVKKLIMISKKQKLLMTVFFYTKTLCKNLAEWHESSQECEISTCLTRELIVTCSRDLTLNHNCLINQMIENINKMKDSFIEDRVIAVRCLFSEDILIITDMTTTKKQLECNLKWFHAVNKNVKINHRKFTIMMHEMWVIFINMSKQKTVICQLLDQNMNLKNSMKILNVRWFIRAQKQSKSFTYLLINMTILKQINLLINEKLIFESKLKKCELFHKKCRIMQCFNCYEYSHTA